MTQKVHQLPRTHRCELLDIPNQAVTITRNRYLKKMGTDGFVTVSRVIFILP
ncbi:MAG: hypothetical protein MRK00_15005 [Nitrosomonas sp.]|nr:hypothetical protein [Nitrosomonas sp.]